MGVLYNLPNCEKNKHLQRRAIPQSNMTLQIYMIIGTMWFLLLSPKCLTCSKAQWHLLVVTLGKTGYWCKNLWTWNASTVKGERASSTCWRWTPRPEVLRGNCAGNQHSHVNSRHLLRSGRVNTQSLWLTNLNHITNRDQNKNTCYIAKQVFVKLHKPQNKSAS